MFVEPIHWQVWMSVNQYVLILNLVKIGKCLQEGGLYIVLCTEIIWWGGGGGGGGGV